MGVVKFGTDGWRGIIADDFTYDKCACGGSGDRALCAGARRRGAGVCIGYDTRFGSQTFARVVAEVLRGARASRWRWRTR